MATFILICFYRQEESKRWIFGGNVLSVFTFRNGEFAFNYDKRTKDALVEFMKNPVEQKAPPPVDMWAGVPGVENVHQLSTKTFHQFVTDNPSTLVMFYAPCK